MLQVNIITTGSLKEKNLSSLVKEYEKRMDKFCKFHIIELPEKKIIDEKNKKEIEKALLLESQQIQKKIPKDSYIISLCIEGKPLSSSKFAQLLQSIPLSHSKLVFLIGSSHGLHPSLKSAAHLQLSLSEMTFPHQLFRLMLVEQIYRSFTMIHNIPYHK